MGAKSIKRDSQEIESLLVWWRQKKDYYECMLKTFENALQHKEQIESEKAAADTVIKDLENLLLQSKTIPDNPRLTQ
jgi:hypothetical protein